MTEEERVLAEVLDELTSEPLAPHPSEAAAFVMHALAQRGAKIVMVYDDE